jgi:hypothetical protein
MPKEERRHLAQWMKVFMDESLSYSFVKIVVIRPAGK